MSAVPAVTAVTTAETPALDREADDLAAWLAAGEVAVLSGAGVSTESGIPDYRGPQGSLLRNTPMTYQEFTGDPEARRRYWARSFVGWRRMAVARPNDGHRALAALQHTGHVDAIITQNVDGLHQAAGAQGVVELHGALDRVRCLDCGAVVDRRAHDARLAAANPGLAELLAPSGGAEGADAEGLVNADGDAEVVESAVARFTVVPCAACGGVLKPDVVFFGEAVPPVLVELAYELVDESRALLVVGSSLTVMSGRRFVLRAGRAGRPVGIANQGPTAAEGYASRRWWSPLGPLLSAAVERL